MNNSASVMFAAFDALVCTAMVWNPLTRSMHISGVISKITSLSATVTEVWKVAPGVTAIRDGDVAAAMQVAERRILAGREEVLRLLQGEAKIPTTDSRSRA